MNALRECESSQTSQAPEARDESQEQQLAAALQAPASRPGRVEFGRYVGWVVGATFLVAVLPTAFVWWLRSDGVIRSPLLTLVVALVATLAASRVGTMYWEKRTSPGDLLFGELLLWGFIRRCNSERRLSSAQAVLGSLADTHAALNGGRGDGRAGGGAREAQRRAGGHRPVHARSLAPGRAPLLDDRQANGPGRRDAWPASGPLRHSTTSARSTRRRRCCASRGG